jgi:hypothetical integral membrane protein (TIGR02206 family)
VRSAIWSAASFSAYGPSHWVVLALFAVGVLVLVPLGRSQDYPAARRFSKVFAVVVLVAQLTIQVYSMTRWRIDHSLPLQLSDLAGYVSAYALWSYRRWACTLMYYWGLTLSTQALVTPALRGPDFPDVEFLAFWIIHLVVIWAAVYLTWGRRIGPTWRGFRFTVLVTLCWAAAMLVFNHFVGTNYGFLNAKPAQSSLLDLMGPWPWYLIPEFTLVIGAWALMTWPWERVRASSGGSRTTRQ